MKKIGLDLRILSNRQRAGIERYTVNVCRELLAPSATYADQEAWIVGEPPAEPHLDGARRIPLDLPLSDCAAANRILSLALELEGCDLLWSPYYPVPERRTFAAVLTIHDLIALRQGELFPSPRSVEFFDRDIRAAAAHADQIIAVSQATRRDVVELLDVPEDRITVISEAADPAFVDRAARADAAIPLDAYGITRPYVLSVCTLEPRKNLHRTIAAYDLLRQQNPEVSPQLVLVGKTGWKVELIEEALSRSPFRGDIVTTGYVPDEHLPPLYAGAELFVYPSLMEGFGLPVLEAMACGAPVLTSDRSSLPEVGGDAVQTCDPTSVDSIAAAMETVLSSSDLRADLSARGQRRAAEFSWRRTADQMRALFDEVLG